METLNSQELLRTTGGDDFSWTDFFGGMIFAADVACGYTRNPYVCAGALASHGVFYFLDF